MTYYHAEHQAAYEQIARRGLSQWNELFEADRPNSYEDFPNREFARQRGLDIRFDVQDMCVQAHVPAPRRYDLVVDSFCLQSIVTDEDRAKLFAAVRARLAPGGHYLISTAMYEPEREYEDGFRYDETTGVCYEAVPDQVDGAVDIEGRWYQPHRRHLRPDALHMELTRAGFHVLTQESRGGEVVCTSVT